MRSLVRPASFRRRAIAVGALCLAVSACGGESDDSSQSDGADSQITTANDTDASPSDADSSSGAAAEGFDLGDDFPTADGLIPELAGLPVPTPVVFGVGTAYTEDQDPRQTAIQALYFSAPVEDVVAFYLDELPAAGYQIQAGIGGGISDKNDIVPGDPAIIIFNRPDGLPGQITFGPGVVATSQLNINVYYSGVR